MVNQILFDLINGLAGKVSWLDNLMIIIAKYFVFIGAGFLVYLFIIKRKKFVFVFLSMIFSLFISKLIGWLIYTPRPFVNEAIQLVEHVADSSFPSDHGVALFSLAFGLLLVREKKAGILFLILACLLGFARVFTGLHYPVDILGSIFVAGICVGVVYFLCRIRN